MSERDPWDWTNERDNNGGVAPLSNTLTIAPQHEPNLPVIQKEKNPVMAMAEGKLKEQGSKMVDKQVDKLITPLGKAPEAMNLASTAAAGTEGGLGAAMAEAAPLAGEGGVGAAMAEAAGSAAPLGGAVAEGAAASGLGAGLMTAVPYLGAAYMAGKLFKLW